MGIWLMFTMPIISTMPPTANTQPTTILPAVSTTTTIINATSTTAAGISSTSFTDTIDLVVKGASLLIALAGFILSIYMFRYGVKKVKKFFDNYQQKKFEATFNFYTNLEALLKRLYYSISEERKAPEKSNDYKTSTPAAVLNHIWGNDNHGNNYNSEIELLKNTVEDFLHFISTSREQIPPSMDAKKLTEWGNNKSTLIVFLSSLMPYRPIHPGGAEEIEISKTYKELEDILIYFIKKVEEQYEECSKQIKQETKGQLSN